MSTEIADIPPRPEKPCSKCGGRPRVGTQTWCRECRREYNRTYNRAGGSVRSAAPAPTAPAVAREAPQADPDGTPHHISIRAGAGWTTVILTTASYEAVCAEVRRHDPYALLIGERRGSHAWKSRWSAREAAARARGAK